MNLWDAIKSPITIVIAVGALGALAFKFGLASKLKGLLKKDEKPQPAGTLTHDQATREKDRINEGADREVERIKAEADAARAKLNEKFGPRG